MSTMNDMEIEIEMQVDKPPESESHEKLKSGLIIGAGLVIVAVAALMFVGSHGHGHAGWRLSRTAVPEATNGGRGGNEVQARAQVEGDDSQAPEAKVGVCHGWCNMGHVEMEVPTCALSGMDRLREAFQDENCATALQSKYNAQMVGKKLQKLTTSPFVFFRGAAGFFYHDMFCYDFPDEKGGNDEFDIVPQVTSNGDCHPENFGVMAMANGKMVWGVNDFDQAFHTPFLWDVRRGAAGFFLHCHVAGYDEPCEHYAQAFVRGYFSVVDRAKMTDCQFSDEETFIEGSKASLDAPMLTELFKELHKRDTPEGKRAWLEKMVDPHTQKFKAKAGKIILLPEAENAKFQKVVEKYLYSGVAFLATIDDPKSFFKVLSVARKEGSGTGSIGLNRYWVLLQGETGDVMDNRVLELKQSSESVLEKYSQVDVSPEAEARRAADGERGAFPYANLFYSAVNFDGGSYLARERFRYKGDVDISLLDKTEFMKYALLAGKAQAHYHMLVTCAAPSCKLAAAAETDDAICNRIVLYHAMHPEIEHHTADYGVLEAKNTIHAWKLLTNALSSDKLKDSPVDFLAWAKGSEPQCAV